MRLSLLSKSTINDRVIHESLQLQVVLKQVDIGDRDGLSFTDVTVKERGVKDLKSAGVRTRGQVRTRVKDLKSPDLAIFRFPFTPTTPFISGLCA